MLQKREFHVSHTIKKAFRRFRKKTRWIVAGTKHLFFRLYLHNSPYSGSEKSLTSLNHPDLISIYCCYLFPSMFSSWISIEYRLLDVKKNKQSFNPIFDLGGCIWRKLFHLYVIRTELDIYACIKTHMFISIGITICYWNKNLIIQFSGHDAFWNNLHQVRSQSKDWKAK